MRKERGFKVINEITIDAEDVCAECFLLYAVKYTTIEGLTRER